MSYESANIGRNYPLAERPPAAGPICLGGFFAVALEEWGYPHLTTVDQQRLSDALSVFLFAAVEGAAR